MSLTPAERLVLTRRLSDAEDAYHKLNTGFSARVVVDQNGERVEFTAVNRAGLYSYILELKTKLGCLATGTQPVNGPAGFTF